MKSSRVSFDFTDSPQILEMLRSYAASHGLSQKTVLVQALESYFAEKMETRMLWRAAEKAFEDWNNPDDETYNTL